MMLFSQAGLPLSMILFDNTRQDVDGIFRKSLDEKGKGNTFRKRGIHRERYKQPRGANIFLQRTASIGQT